MAAAAAVKEEEWEGGEEVHNSSAHELVAPAQQQLAQRARDNAAGCNAHRRRWCSVSREPERSRLRSSRNSKGDTFPVGAPPPEEELPPGGGLLECIVGLRDRPGCVDSNASEWRRT